MLYHLSLTKVEKFYPRIPQLRFDNEDDVIDRICFSTSIEGAFTSMSGGINKLINLRIFEEKIDIPAIVYLYKIDNGSIDSKNILSPEMLVSKGLVPDAHIGKEVWIVNQEVLCEEKVIRIKNYNFSRKDFEYNKSYVEMVEKIEYENSIENYKREYVYKFSNNTQCKYICELAILIGCKYEKMSNSKIKIIVPASINIKQLWTVTNDLKWSELLEELSLEASIETVMSTNFDKKIR